MPRLAERAFTDVYLRSLKSERRRDYYDSAQRGLGLRVAPSGLKTWFVMRRVAGRQTRFMLGRYPELNLAAARQKAAGVLEDIAAGKPAKRAPTPTFETVLADWFAKDQGGRRSAYEKRRALHKDALPRLGKCPVDQIGRGDIRALVDAIVDRGAPIHANRVLAYLRRLFNWCVERDLITSSPTAGIKPPAKERSRERTLTRDELAAILSSTDKLPMPFGPFFHLLLLTGQRRSEVAGAKWTEIDLLKAEWTIPAARAKNGKAHIVHLSREALDILSSLPRIVGNQFVFTTTGRTPISGFSKSKAGLDADSGVTDWTIHDLRRTFATIATGELGIEPVVVDKILNHSSGVVKGVAAIYQRHAYLEQRRRAMTMWGEFLSSLHPEGDSDV